MLHAQQLRLSRLFAPTLKATPTPGPGRKDVAHHPASADLLVRGGFLRPAAASGYFALLPLGLRVLGKVEALVHEELGAVGCQPVSLPCVSSLALWRKSGRWSDDRQGGSREMFRLQDRRGGEFCLAVGGLSLLLRWDWLGLGGGWERGGQLARMPVHPSPASPLVAPHRQQPTHEEDITNLVAREVTSYRQLPLRLYQVGR
jgi:prolyl-tRNA synthetase